MKLSCSTLYISHPIAIRHGQLGFTKQFTKPIIDYFLKLKEEDQPTSESWKTNHEIHLDHDIISPLLDNNTKTYFKSKATRKKCPKTYFKMGLTRKIFKDLF